MSRLALKKNSKIKIHKERIEKGKFIKTSKDVL